MEAILYISAGVIAAAFVILVIYLIKTLKTLSETLNNISSTLDNVEKHVKGVTEETEKLLHKTNVLADDLQQKSARLNSVVDHAKEVGETIQKFNGSLQSITQNISFQLQRNQDKVAQIVQWANIAIEMKDKIEEILKRKKQEKAAKSL